MLSIEALGLTGNALAGAQALEAKFPGLQFTSGRRAVPDQARAMAGNIVLNRKWIGETYVDTLASRALQHWVDTNPQAKTAVAIAAGLTAVMTPWGDAMKALLSKHFSGQAFDLQPLAQGALANAVIAFIHTLPGLDKFLTREGGLIRWHLQFHN